VKQHTYANNQERYFYLPGSAGISKLTELVSDSATSLPETLNEKNSSVSAVEVDDEVVEPVRFFICAAALDKSNSRMRATEVDGTHITRRLKHGCLK